MNMSVRTNYDNDELYCIFCKERIEIGERYAIVNEEIYDGEILEKVYHLPDCVPEDEDFEEE